MKDKIVGGKEVMVLDKKCEEILSFIIENKNDQNIAKIDNSQNKGVCNLLCENRFIEKPQTTRGGDAYITLTYQGLNYFENKVKEEKMLSSSIPVNTVHIGDNISGNKVGGNQYAQCEISNNSNKETIIKLYQKEGVWGGLVSGIISGLALWGIKELIMLIIGG